MRRKRAFALAGSLLLLAAAARSQETPPPISIRPAAGPIEIDGDLGDPGWQGAARIERFWEANPGDNVSPPARTTALLTYDDRYVYLGFICEDPHPDRIRAPYVDRDNIVGTDDNIAVFLDTRGDKRSALEFRINPRGQQADGSYNDANGNEDFSPDYFYDTAGKVTGTGWQAEMRIPFSSLRYEHGKPQHWSILIWRNYPRDFRYGIYNAPIPRSSNCLICHAVPIEGLENLPSGGHLIVAPYATVTERQVPRDGPGSDFLYKPARGTGGLDVKWIPGPNTALDATINPDFSQVESDVGQISINKQFAIFYPEKRPFFLEGVDLLDTPIQAVYTRTITSPRWGARATGKFDDTAYTLLVTQDRGGGSVVIPGPTSSDFAPQDFSSIAAIGRARMDIGTSFAAFLVTDRENASADGGGHNRVLGPDFQWRPNQQDQITGQILVSDTQSPNRPDVYPTWDGRRVTSRAMTIEWRHNSYHWFYRARYDDYGDGFRADDGFVPQVGHRFEKLVAGYSVYDLGFFSQLAQGLFCNLSQRSDGALIQRQCGIFINPSGFHNIGGEIDIVPKEKDRAFDTVVDSDFAVLYDVSIDPGRVFSRIELYGFVGDHADFANARPGNGAEVGVNATVKPFDHLALDFNGDRQWLDVDANGRSGRLFTAQIGRLKATYNFSSRSFLRLIGQYYRATRNPELYDFSVPSLEKSFTGSALFAYRINWQTVLFLGLGDSHALNERDALVPSTRELFLKVSYAFQL
jgi:hypothetical protein